MTFKGAPCRHIELVKSFLAWLELLGQASGGLLVLIVGRLLGYLEHVVRLDRSCNLATRQLCSQATLDAVVWSKRSTLCTILICSNSRLLVDRNKWTSFARLGHATASGASLNLAILGRRNGHLLRWQLVDPRSVK